LQNCHIWKKGEKDVRLSEDSPLVLFVSPGLLVSPDVVVTDADPVVVSGGAGKVCTASAFPTVAPGSEKTAVFVRQHRVFSAADSQQYAPGSSYPSPTHSHTCTPFPPKSYANGSVAES
jgi:hypothetical protein